MWLVGRIREGLDNIPQDLGRYVGKSKDDISAKTSLSNKLHSNILTPGNIPEFCLPPRLTRSPLLASQRTAVPTSTPRINLEPSGSPHRTPHVPQRENARGKSGTEAQKGKKPPPFSAEGYGLEGMHESANTRRKESLFHSSHPVLTLDRSLPLPLPKTTTRAAPERNSPKTNIRSGLTISLKSLSKTGSTESDTPSSNDSTPLSSPLLTHSCSSPTLTLLLEGVQEGHPLLQPGHSRGVPPQGSPLSCLFFTPRQNRRRRGISPKPFPLAHYPNPNLGSLAPPLLFPLDILHCQERPQGESVLPLTERGGVRLSAERTPSPLDPYLSTVRVRVVSVEGLRDDGDLRPLNCCLSLCLTPGKLQRQESAVIKNCRRPVFNEDFFFTDLSPDHLLGLELRVKVLDKAGHSALRKGAVLGVTTESLAQLLPFD
ncbi:C2 calcium-dependent domain-containing protein 4C [Hypomesus transpacificus]|uniref:C2 calcium-dependent domain-containing protein 4C n=1 Tax=Hypomesus transpacificus TaxID=137520 RepID=UPI001F0791D3|nr:C2 calcium-dependent domain-containing protein 4C [Hypomesus transpacificus]